MRKKQEKSSKKTNAKQFSEGKFRKVIAEKFGDNIEEFFKDPEITNLLAKFFAKDSAMTEKQIAKAIIDSDPFSFSTTFWQTTVICLFYQFYDAFKQTSLGQQILVGGNTYKHLWEVRGVRGLLRKNPNIINPQRRVYEGVEGRELDQDYNFELHPIAPTYQNFWLQVRNSGQIPSSEVDELDRTISDPSNDYWHTLHCEIIPCDQGKLRGFIRDLDRWANANRNGVINDVLIEVDGTLTWDGTHGVWPGHLEIHPVSNARCIQTIPFVPGLRCV